MLLDLMTCAPVRRRLVNDIGLAVAVGLFGQPQIAQRQLFETAADGGVRFHTAARHQVCGFDAIFIPSPHRRPLYQMTHSRKPKPEAGNSFPAVPMEKPPSHFLRFDALLTFCSCFVLYDAEVNRMEKTDVGVSGGLGGATKAEAVTSRYLEAGSPICCFLPSCRKPFRGTCIHANDGRFYCSHDCAEEGAKIDLSHVETLKRKAQGK